MKPYSDILVQQMGFINPDKPVEVYRNLHKKCYSVRQSGVVRFYTNHIALKNVKFVVREKGRQKVLKERQKNIHAFVKGFIVADFGFTYGDQIRYNPYLHEKFTGPNGHVEQCEYVLLWRIGASTTVTQIYKASP